MRMAWGLPDSPSEALAWGAVRATAQVDTAAPPAFVPALGSPPLTRNVIFFLALILVYSQRGLFLKHPRSRQTVIM